MYEQTKDEVLEELSSIISALGSDIDSLLWNTTGVDVSLIAGAASDLSLPVPPTVEGVDRVFGRLQDIVDTIMDARRIADDLVADLDCGLRIMNSISEHVNAMMAVVLKPNFKPGDIVSINDDCAPNSGLRHERYLVEGIAGDAEDIIWAWLRPLVREGEQFVQLIPGITSRGTVEMIDNLTLLT